MKTRLQAFHELKEHAWFSRVYAKLKQKDLALCEAFIQENDQLGSMEYEYAINRMFLGKVPPNNMAIIQELLQCSNSAVHPVVHRTLRNTR